MPSIHYLNPPTHPFWDFVSGLEEHPFLQGYGRPPSYRFRGATNENEQAAAQQEQQPAEKSEKAQGKQPSVEDDNQDPPEVDPSTLKDQEVPQRFQDMPFRGRGRFGAAFDEEGPRRGRGCGMRGRGGHGGPHEHGARPGPDGHHGPWWMPHDARRGPRGPGGEPFHGPHRAGPHHHRGHGRHSPDRRGGFDLPEFLKNLGDRLGIDLAGAAEGLGVGNFNAPKNADNDFEPRADVFDTANSYVIHLSLPGAKKEDVGVDYDGENSLLRIAGVVHRPGADEELLKHLAVDGRKREVGVFEKNIRLGTRRDPASIDVNAISAKMTDGVLVVKVPKVEVQHEKRDIVIGSPSPQQAAVTHEQDVDMEKGTLLDMENVEQHTEAVPEKSAADEEAESVREAVQHDTRSETMDVEPDEKLPEYEVEEHEESEEEGEYVKINVD